MKGGNLNMKGNYLTILLGIIAIGFIAVVIDLLTSGRPIITVVYLLVLVLCTLIIEVKSIDDEHNS